MGGGALFFRLFRDGRVRQASLSDMNPELVDAYLAVRDQPGQVIEQLARFTHDRDFYYALRAQDPWSLDLPARAARAIYLNKTGYNGLYRVNRRGEFNVPFGRYKSPKILDRANLLAASEALQRVAIACAPFDAVLDRAQAGDLVYFDPPYAPLSKTACFTGYHPGGFSLEDQRKLRDVCVELGRRGVSVMLSNSDTGFVRSLFSASGFSIDAVLANRAINCNGSRRGKLVELIVTNYPIEKAVQLRLDGNGLGG